MQCRCRTRVLDEHCLHERSHHDLFMTVPCRRRAGLRRLSSLKTWSGVPDEWTASQVLSLPDELVLMPVLRMWCARSGRYKGAGVQTGRWQTRCCNEAVVSIGGIGEIADDGRGRTAKSADPNTDLAGRGGSRSRQKYRYKGF